MTLQLAVSPGLIPRPSLSGFRHDREHAGVFHVAGDTLRPSLSDEALRHVRPDVVRVAEVYPPAFVERSPSSST